MQKLQQIAAKDLGGKPEDYEVANERVFRKGGGAGMSLAQAAKRAIELGGIYDGHELPKGINKMTAASATALAGQGLLAVARDTMPRDGQTHSFVAGFAEVEVDLETGKYHIMDYLAVADVGTVHSPPRFGRPGSRPLRCSVSVTRWSEVGLRSALRSAARQALPPQQVRLRSLMFPSDMKWDAVDIPDPETPVGARGIGEPPVGAGCMAIVNALSDALGDEVFRRAPVMADTILASLEAGQAHGRGPDGPHLRRLEYMAIIRDIMPAFELFQPATHRRRTGACSITHGSDAWVLAGGLDSFDWLKDRIKRPKVVVDLSQINELRGRERGEWRP